MFCPNCGRENPGKQKFCTACGLQLNQVEFVVQSQVGKQPATDQYEIPAEKFSWNRLLQQPLLYGLLLTLLGVIVAGGAHSDRNLADLGTIITIFGVGLIAVKSIMLMIKDHRAPARLPKPEKSEGRQLPPVMEGSSVTEQTTRQLEPELYPGQK